MTRRELAKQITILTMIKGKHPVKNMKAFYNSLIKGCGSMKPQSKAELQSWYNNLILTK